MEPSLLEIPGMDTPIRLHLHQAVDTCLSRHIREHHIWEPYETALVVDCLERGDVFLDVGANIGYYTALAAVLVQERGLVVAYEPDIDNYDLLMKNMAANHVTNARCFCAAMADYTGDGRIYLSETNRGDHRLYDPGEGRTCCPISVVHGGDHLSGVTDRVDFIKIDTQGSETAVITGLKKVIQANRDHLSMIVEFWPYGLRRAGSSGRELLSGLSAFDMPLYLIDHIGHHLVPVTAEFLGQWVDQTDSDPENQGFVNLLVGHGGKHARIQ
ncbi:methyltransferase FkbM family [Desulfosudis oleivorans Hxd3]|uniref:Methyltransferase FkbM family n=2 Tax=Desulfosudis TaxID=2904716 RepID=A8ZVH8_DESOH|nr:methyltransferase FkbM family [Desulfosudis oleivorans Hxd3]